MCRAAKASSEKREDVNEEMEIRREFAGWRTIFDGDGLINLHGRDGREFLVDDFHEEGSIAGGGGGG